VTYAAKITKDEAQLNFKESAIALARKIRAFNPFPGAFGLFNDVPLKLWQAEIVPNPDATLPGEILSADAEGVVIACGSNALRVTQLQKPGGKRLPAREFLQGFALTDGRFSN
jgi:methionyl-tRNA formyltransferase